MATEPALPGSTGAGYSAPIRYKRHPRYYFDDGNLFILVRTPPPAQWVRLTRGQINGGILFNLHRSLLCSGTDVSPQFLRDSMIHWSGRSAQQPMQLTDIRSEEFEMFLSLVYPSSVIFNLRRTYQVTDLSAHVGLMRMIAHDQRAWMTGSQCSTNAINGGVARYGPPY